MNWKQNPLLCILAFLVFNQGMSQQVIAHEAELDALRATPLETLYLHLNRTTLFPGETLYFSLYGINLQSYRTSNISKMAYVQLLDATGTTVASQKVRLYQGRGQGDLFMSTRLASGAYTLIAFTNWMKNAGVNQFYKTTVNVVNPYESSPNLWEVHSRQENTATLTESKEDKENLDLKSGISLNTSCNICPALGQVTLQIQNLDGVLSKGSYSLSISRVEEIPEWPAVSAVNFSGTYSAMQRQIAKQVRDTVWIPEQREALISGKLIDADQNGISGVPLIVSLPGKNFQLLPAITNESGQFFAYMKAPFEGDFGNINSLTGISANQKVIFQDLSEFKGRVDLPRPIQLDSSYAEAIRQRSVHNQIENSYFEAKPDTVRSVFTEESFFGHLPRTYDLEEYTQFKTLREVLIEIIQDVWVRKDLDKKETLWVRAPAEIGTEVFTSDPPIVTLDGVFIPNHEKILDMEARRLKFIRVMQEDVVLGERKYQGMVALETRYEDYAESGITFAMTPSAPVKSYYQEFSSPKRNRIPDFRHQLYWNPKFELDQSSQILSFMTSGVPGTYSVSLEGFTTYGKPVSVISYFEVVE